MTHLLPLNYVVRAIVHVFTMHSWPQLVRA